MYYDNYDTLQSSVYIEQLHTHVSLRLIRDGKFWWAEGVEWDYGAQGNDPTDAILNFKRGFQATIIQNIKRFGFMDWDRWRWPSFEVKVPGPIVQRIERRFPKA